MTGALRGAGPAEDGIQHFSDEVLPLLREHCFDCHSHESGDASGGLMLDSLSAMTTGGTRGAAVVPGAADESLLLRAVLYEDPELQMPPEGRLSDADVQLLRNWIASGAAVPQEMRGEPTSTSTTATQQVAESHWAYQSPRSWSEASQSRATSPENVIDRIVESKLSDAGLELSDRASRGVLIRRLYYDLVGLPPSFTDVTAYVGDPRDDRIATAELVDRLLASPHYGERWARYWMDLARYADNKGYVFQEDREYPEAFRYRDWLVSAFNRDLPYDDFVVRQLAADVMEQADPSDLPALGFLTLGRRFLNNKFDIVDDRLDVVTRGIMGMTLTCARCHDHKYDPISQADYYALAGVFLSTEEPGGEPWPHRLAEAENPRDAHILIRGSPGNRGDKVSRRFVSFLAPEEQPFTQGSGRLELAKQLVTPGNPLTARVMANRVWTRLLGTSLTDSPSDFGLRCPKPEQLELLDQLAIEFIQAGWSVKRLIRLVANSEVYAQQSTLRPEAYEVDPENKLYWRANGRRLDFEALRDTLLARSGNLEFSMGGKPLQIEATSSAYRRTIYSYIDRQNLPSLFRTFDFASPDAHSPQRAETSVPQQGLYLLNSDFVAELALDLASQSSDESDSAERIQWLCRRILARPANDDELSLMQQFVATTNQHPEASQPPERWICGYGPFDPELNSLRDFKRLPTFADGRWQGGPTLPDPQLGWCMLNAEGGHAGNDLQHAAVRRWIAPRDGQVRVSGVLRHKAEEGDGVRGTILHQGEMITQEVAKNGKASAGVRSLEVLAGQTIDFVTDCISGPSHDSFEWKASIRYTDADGAQFDSANELPKPLLRPLDSWAQLSQALLLTNELIYID